MAIKKLIAKEELTEIEKGIQIRDEAPETPVEDQLWYQDDTKELKVRDVTDITLSTSYIEGQYPSEEVAVNNGVFEENPYKYISTISGAGGVIYRVAEQTDGKIIVVGAFTSFGGLTRNYIVRLNANGTEDSVFYGTLVTGGAFNGEIRDVVIQPDNKIILVGNFTSFKGVTRNRIVRINNDGTEDSAFYTALGTGVNGLIINKTLKLQPNGKILFGGQFTTVNGVTRNRVVRLNANGSVDTDFSTALGTASATNDVNVIELLNDGKIAIGGAFTTFNGIARNYITVRNSDGTEDASFYNTIGKNIVGGPNSTAFNNIVDTIKYHKNKIYIGGAFTAINGITRNRLCKLNENGTIDFDFATNIGSGAGATIISISFDEYDNIFIAGTFTTFNGSTFNRICALTSNGLLKSEYNIMFGTGFNDVCQQVVHTSRGVTLLVGNFTTLNAITKNRIVFFEHMSGPAINWEDGVVYSYQLKEYSENLDLDIIQTEEDTSFYTNLGTSFNGRIRQILRQPDGKLLVAGEFTTFNGATRNRLVRIHPDGTPDITFNALIGTGFNQFITSIALQSDGKILVGGAFSGASSFNGQTRNRLIRLNSDGSEDTAFYTNLGTGFNAQVETIKIQNDGKILVGGLFTQLNSITRNYFVRLNNNGVNDGTVDTTHYTALGTAFNSTVYDILVNPDDSIILVGTFTTFNAVTRNRIVKLNSAGAVDTAFYTALGTAFSGATDVWRIVKHLDGMIIIGNFTTFNAVTRNRIIKLNADGTQNTAFNSNIGVGFSAYVRCIEVQSDGKILVGGNFIQFNSKECKRIVRLNPDGREDYKFNAAFRSRSTLATTMEADNDVWAVCLAGSSYYLGGDFLNFDNAGKIRMVKYDETLNLSSDDKSIYFALRAGDFSVEIFPSSIVEE